MEARFGIRFFQPTSRDPWYLCVKSKCPISLFPVLAEISASRVTRSLLLNGSGDPFHALISIFKNVEFAYLSVVMAID